jgi:hypothetical protein
MIWCEIKGGREMRSFKPYRLRKAVLILPLGLLLMAIPLSIALAAPPASGTVVEGISAPGAVLGDTRADVEASYGDPSYCQGPVQDFCTYNVSGLGSVNVRYRGPDGGGATGTSADVLYYLSFIGFPDWITTAGVSTPLALADPEAVISAYPNGEVIYNIFGDIYQVRDQELGVSVTWIYNFYTGTVYTSITIYKGTGSSPPPTPSPTPTPVSTLPPSPTPTSTPPPDPTATPTPEPSSNLLHVVAIDMNGTGRSVTAAVWIADQDGTSVSSALVSADWTLPNGDIIALSGVTKRNGRVLFSVGKSAGLHTITITGVSFDGYGFDPANSQLTQSIFIP